MRLNNPVGRLLLVKLAIPEESTVPVPSNVAPLKKLTVPAGVPVGAGSTVAVKATGCPAKAVPGAATNVVAVTV